MLRLSLILTLLICAPIAQAAIVVSAVATQQEVGNNINVTVSMFGGSDTAAIQTVARYRINVEVVNAANAQVTPASIVPASVLPGNSSEWAAPGIGANGGSAFETDTGSGLFGNVAIFAGQTNNGFAANNRISTLATNNAHLMGTLNFTFAKPAPGTPDQVFTIRLTDRLFQNWVGAANAEVLTTVVSTFNSTTFTITAVPEPSSLLLCVATAAAGFGFRRRRS